MGLGRALICIDLHSSATISCIRLGLWDDIDRFTVNSVRVGSWCDCRLGRLHEG